MASLLEKTNDGQFKYDCLATASWSRNDQWQVSVENLGEKEGREVGERGQVGNEVVAHIIKDFRLDQVKEGELPED